LVGHETTAGSLTFTLWELSRHPDIQARLRTEIISSGRNLSYDDLQQLQFLDAVIKEGLRLYPAAPLTQRVVVQDDVLPVSKTVNGMGTVRVKKGQIFIVPFTPMNTNPNVWGPSSIIFDPSRWLDKDRMPSPSELPHGWSGLSTFCDGPRNCLGWRLAVLEMKVILATLIRSLIFYDSGANVQQKISPTLQPVINGKGGFLPLIIANV